MSLSSASATLLLQARIGDRVEVGLAPAVGLEPSDGPPVSDIQVFDGQIEKFALGVARLNGK